MTATTGAREFNFTDRDSDRVRKLVKQHTGIHLEARKRDMVYGRLARRLRKLNLRDFADYLALLDNGNESELIEFTNSITTNVTKFFREEHHFDYIARTLLPYLYRARSGTKRLRLWSAGCSSGQEPYSLAMILAENPPPDRLWDIKILATDLDSNILKIASAGEYGADAVDGVSKPRLSRWFSKSRVGDKLKIHPELRRMISFKQLNLMEGWPMRGEFDLIMCRNVIIYFDKPTQYRLFDRYGAQLAQDGYLMLGHSESVPRDNTVFDSVGRTIYRRSQAQRKAA